MDETGIGATGGQRVDPAKVRLVPLRMEDEQQLAQLFADNDVPEVTRFFDPFPLSAEAARSLTHHQGRDRYWGIWLAGRLVGLTMVRGWDGGHPHPTLGILMDRGVARQGVGQTAVARVLEWMRAAGEPLLRARIHEDNAGSLRMTEKRGWTEISRGNGRVVMEIRFD